MEDLQSLVRDLEETQYVCFAREFLRHWSEVGFGAFGKRDTELLLFHCLQLATNSLPDRPKTNYEWGRLLRLTASRVRNLRRDAYMRFGRLLTEDEGTDLLARAISVMEELDVDASGESVVRLLADDPVVEIELQPRLRAVHGYYTFERNREILRIPLRHFLALVDHLLGVEGEKTFRELLEKANAADSEISDFNDDMASLDWADKSEAEKAIHFLEFLAKTFAPEKVDELVGYLSRIRASQRWCRD